MKVFSRIVTFGVGSGLLWSAVPGFLGDLFTTHSKIPITVLSGIVSGVLTSLLLASLFRWVSRDRTIFLGLVSLPFGAFLFGFSLAVINHFFPTLANGSFADKDPWTLGFLFVVFCFVPPGLFLFYLPLAVATTLLLRSFVDPAVRTHNGA